MQDASIIRLLVVMAQSFITVKIVPAIEIAASVAFIRLIRNSRSMATEHRSQLEESEEEFGIGGEGCQRLQSRAFKSTLLSQ